MWHSTRLTELCRIRWPHRLGVKGGDLWPWVGKYSHLPLITPRKIIQCHVATHCFWLATVKGCVPRLCCMEVPLYEETLSQPSPWHKSQSHGGIAEIIIPFYPLGRLEVINIKCTAVVLIQGLVFIIRRSGTWHRVRRCRWTDTHHSLSFYFTHMYDFTIQNTLTGFASMQTIRRCKRKKKCCIDWQHLHARKVLLIFPCLLHMKGFLTLSTEPIAGAPAGVAGGESTPLSASSWHSNVPTHATLMQKRKRLSKWTEQYERPHLCCASFISVRHKQTEMLVFE